MKKSGKSPQKAEKKMTDKPKPWPYNAAHARDRSAEEAQRIVQVLEDALEFTNDPNVLRRIAKALASAHLILRHLEGQGARTVPD